MKDELAAVLGDLFDPVVDPYFFPSLKEFGFLFRKIGLHRKVCSRQFQSLPIIHRVHPPNLAARVIDHQNSITYCIVKKISDITKTYTFMIDGI